MASVARFQAALSAKADPRNVSQSISARLIPAEPLYMLLNAASSGRAGLPVHPDLPMPQEMEVDWVRVWQDPSRHTTGCDTRTHPTAKYIEEEADRSALASLAP